MEDVHSLKPGERNNNNVCCADGSTPRIENKNHPQALAIKVEQSSKK